MKTLALFWLIVLMALASGAGPQIAAQDPADLSVLKYSWTKERIGWERDPFSAPKRDEHAQLRHPDGKRHLPCVPQPVDDERRQPSHYSRRQAGLLNRRAASHV